MKRIIIAPYCIITKKNECNIDRRNVAIDNKRRIL